MSEKNIFIRRSTLILPVNKKKFVEKAWLRGADAIQLDLEDGIEDTQKEAARGMVKDAIAIVGKGGADVLVRINYNEDFKRDLVASVYPGLDTVILPKVEDVGFVREVESIVNQLEIERNIRTGSIKIGVLIETAKGFMNMNQIVNCSKRIITINLGTEDFTLDLQIEPSVGGSEIFVPKVLTVITARAAGIHPMGIMGSMTNYQDLVKLYQDARSAYRNGYIGSSCIHPSQVAVLNKAFAPTPEEIEQAKNIIAVYEEALQSGEGATSYEGKMIDAPVANRAYHLLNKAQAIAAIEKRKEEALEKNTKN